jgi:hypothetical protein
METNQFARIFLLVDWETEKWMQIYCKSMRDASLAYTFSKQNYKQ